MLSFGNNFDPPKSFFKQQRHPHYSSSLYHAAVIKMELNLLLFYIA